MKRNNNLAPSGQTTQFIVGASDESDADILKRVNWLYKKMDIKRSYFSPFNSMKDTPLENRMNRIQKELQDCIKQII